MSIYKLKAAPIILIEDDCNKNILPLILELVHDKIVKCFCLEKPADVWNRVFENNANITCFDGLLKYGNTHLKHTILIDSVNQMALNLGWEACYSHLKQFQKDSNVIQMILILHKDCFLSSSKIQLNLEHFASAIISYITNFKVNIQIKKGGKFHNSHEILFYDIQNKVLKSRPETKENLIDEPEKTLPKKLTTFKIEMEENEKLDRYKLKLPYMSKQEGESKVFYEPDAVDDWDEEDPDEDLDI